MGSWRREKSPHPEKLLFPTPVTLIALGKYFQWAHGMQALNSLQKLDQKKNLDKYSGNVYGMNESTLKFYFAPEASVPSQATGPGANLMVLGTLASACPSVDSVAGICPDRG